MERSVRLIKWSPSWGVMVWNRLPRDMKWIWGGEACLSKILILLLKTQTMVAVSTGLVRARTATCLQWGGKTIPSLLKHYRGTKGQFRLSITKGTSSKVSIEVWFLTAILKMWTDLWLLMLDTSHLWKLDWGWIPTAPLIRESSLFCSSRTTIYNSLTLAPKLLRRAERRAKQIMF
jgi:hypothetical protein